MRRDFPLSFFWGIVMVVLGFGGLFATHFEIGAIVLNLAVMGIGLWLARRGWMLSR